jgi:hypothetical protein
MENVGKNGRNYGAIEGERMELMKEGSRMEERRMM